MKSMLNSVWLMLRQFLGLWILLGMLAGIQGCDNDDDPVGPVNLPEGPRVLIINEGGFQAGNASLDVFSLRDNVMSSSVFDSVNLRPLGDVFQSLTITDASAFLVINGSGKIEVIDTETYRSNGTITGLLSPRYMLPVNSIKAYVSDLAANSIQVLDLRFGTVPNTIPLPGWSEQMVRVDDLVYVANLSREYLYVIDPAQDAVVDSIEVALGGSELEVDAQGNIWLFCVTDFNVQNNARLFQIDPRTRSVIQDLDFQQQIFYTDMDMNGGKDTLFFLNTDLYRMPVSAQALPSQPFITAQGGANFYGLGVDPETSIIYLADATDFSSRGFMARHRPDGVAIDLKPVGVIPSDFFFLR